MHLFYEIHEPPGLQEGPQTPPALLHVPSPGSTSLSNQYSPGLVYLCSRLKHLSSFFKILFIHFLEREREEERERNINVWLPLKHPLLGTWLATQACAPTGNQTWDQTSDSFVHSLALNPLSHTRQGRNICHLCFDSFLHYLHAIDHQVLLIYILKCLWNPPCPTFATIITIIIKTSPNSKDQLEWIQERMKGTNRNQ